MQAHCQRCGKPQHVVGGSETRIVEAQRYLRRGQPLIVQQTRRAIQGTCDVCGATLTRLLPRHDAQVEVRQSA